MRKPPEVGETVIFINSWHEEEPYLQKARVTKTSIDMFNNEHLGTRIRLDIELELNENKVYTKKDILAMFEE